jgi:hypothetical protein
MVTSSTISLGSIKKLWLPEIIEAIKKPNEEKKNEPKADSGAQGRSNSTGRRSTSALKNSNADKNSNN